MPIHYDAEREIFHLQTRRTSYVISLAGGRFPQHVYWGGRIADFRADCRRQYPSFWAAGKEFTKDEFSLDTIPQEYPSYGSSDLRSPAVQVLQQDGSTVSEFFYDGYRIFGGKPPLEGLPATYAEGEDEAQTLEITLRDPVGGLAVVLSYTVFNDFDAITRSVRLINGSSKKMKILRALSVNVDFADGRFDMLQFSGRWAKERQLVRRSLVPGEQAVESRRGISSHQQNPFFILARPGADETAGEVYGFNLVYSGNFLANVEVDQYGCARAQMGINPFDFAWGLEPGASFQTPEVVMAFSAGGLGGMSHIYHDLYRARLCRGKYRDRVRPVLINNWEATYFNFNESKLLDIAGQAKDLGIEMFVLDDGWFGHRDSDRSSLGDWTVDRRKIPGGLAELAAAVNRMGLKFGLWFEPEMVSPDSDLYRAHPDWCLHVDGRACSLGRHQLVLDLSRGDVQEYVVRSVQDVLSSAHIEYVKWDMNRCLTEMGSALLPAERQRETAHRYVLALYRILDRITSAFPDILFESCASGGGRFDPGMLYYMPQTWTSDMTDAVDRLKIQYGTSFAYPAVTMGAHVSAVPNAQNGRVTPLRTRGVCAMGGCFGYELDPVGLSAKERSEIRLQVAFYKSVRGIIQFGDQYRLQNPFESNTCAWAYVSKDRSEAVVSYFRSLSSFSDSQPMLRLRGLDASAVYRVTEIREGAPNRGEVRGGDELMGYGLIVPPLRGDFRCCLWKLERT